MSHVPCGGGGCGQEGRATQGDGRVTEPRRTISGEDSQSLGANLTVKKRFLWVALKKTALFQLVVVKVKVKSLSHVRLFATLWTVAHQAPPSIGFSRQEHWNELPFPSPRDLPDPGIEPRSPALQADALPSEPPGKLEFFVKI